MVKFWCLQRPAVTAHAQNSCFVTNQCYDAITGKMSVFHDEIEIEDFEYDPELETYFYPCPCGDQFQITKVRSHYVDPFMNFA